jgi:predicted phage baseplate assembly protein
MPIPLPNLDDRRWADLVEEGRSLIPLYSPEWTDHNASDPGITLLELFAWVAEMDIYQANRIPDRHKLKFLELVGIAPAPPSAARAVLALQLQPGNPNLDLPAGVEFMGTDPAGVATSFRSLHATTVIDLNLQAVQSFDGAAYQDLTARRQRGQPLSLMGAIPSAGAGVYLGFDKPLPPGVWTSLYFLTGSNVELTSPHHSARTIWEYLGSNGWLPAVTDDTTRSLTQSGAVRLQISQAMTQSALGDVSAPLFWIRGRLVSGQYDAPPVALYIVANAVEVEQAVPAVAGWNLAAGVVPSGPLPALGTSTGMELSFDSAGRIATLTFSPGAIAQFVVLQISPALILEAVMVGVSDGGPNQSFLLQQAPVEQSTFELYTQDNLTWQAWQQKEDLDESGPGDAHFLLDPTAGAITFGDGAHGRVPAQDALIFAKYSVTRAADGNLQSSTINSLAVSQHNTAALGNSAAVSAQLKSIGNPADAAGGAAAETLAQAIGRAILLREASLRAVTLSDYQTLAMETPGVQLARVGAWANLFPGFDCFPSPGVVTVILVPAMPGPKPSPSSGLKQAVAAYLNPRRIIGTRIEIADPQYVEVTVQATVRTFAGASKTALQQAVVDALNEFFDPLAGGPDQDGWPFGRDVYWAEVMETIARLPNVDRVESLALFADGCGPLCGNICLRPTWLVTPGAHQIGVL